MIFAPLFKEDKPHFHTNGGELAVGYGIYTYYAGTNTPVAMYSDPEGDTQYQNPIVLDSRGEPGGQGIYAIVDHKYKVVLKDTMGGVVWSMDDISPVSDGSGGIPILATLRLLQKDVDNSGHSTEIGGYFPNGADQDIEIPNELCVFRAFQSWFAYILDALLKGKPSFVIESKEWYESGERKTEIYIYQAKKFHQENDVLFSSDNYIEFVRIDDDLKKTTLICRGDDDEGQGHWEKKEEYVGVVFYAEYGETLFDDIKAAYDAGKCVMLKQTISAGELIYNLHEYNHSDAMPQFDNFVFECIEAGTFIRKAVCFVNGSWNSNIYHLVTH